MAQRNKSYVMSVKTNRGLSSMTFEVSSSESLQFIGKAVVAPGTGKTEDKVQRHGDKHVLKHTCCVILGTCIHGIQKHQVVPDSSAKLSL